MRLHFPRKSGLKLHLFLFFLFFLSKHRSTKPVPVQVFPESVIKDAIDAPHEALTLIIGY